MSDATAELPLAAAEGLLLHLEGWEGPLDRLAELARARRIDLATISLRDLVDQYLAHVEGEGRPRVEVAAEYLVMAAWLAYLKSALLLPAEPELEPEAEELAALARHRAKRLAAMRAAARALDVRARLGRDRHARGAPEGLTTARRLAPSAQLHLLLAAYGRLLARAARRTYAPHRRPVVTMADALAWLSAHLAGLTDWTPLARVAPHATPDLARSNSASAFAAALELTRLGRMELRQRAHFAPVELRAR